jgi:hypothetical protein
MKKLKIILIAVLFFVLGSGTSAIFVSNVLNMKSHRLMKGYSQRSAEKQQEEGQNKPAITLKNIEFDSTGLEGVDTFLASVYGDENISKVWPDYQNKLKAILDGGLNKQGLRIVSDAFDENGVPIIPDFLKLTISAVRDEPSQTIAGSVEIYLSGVFVNYQTKKFVSADRWDKTQAFMIKETEAAEHLEKITRGLMNDFIKDYVKANPKKEDAVSFGAASQ